MHLNDKCLKLLFASLMAFSVTACGNTGDPVPEMEQDVMPPAEEDQKAEIKEEPLEKGISFW